MDVVLIENFIQILAYYMLQESIEYSDRSLIVTRELLRGITLTRGPNSRERQVDVQFRILEKRKLAINIRWVEQVCALKHPEGSGNNSFDLESFPSYTIIKRLSESVESKRNEIKVIVPLSSI